MSLTPEQLAAARRWAEETAAAQGLPTKIEDPGTIAKVAALLKPAGRDRAPAPA